MTEGNDLAFPLATDKDRYRYSTRSTDGLTKREQLAAMAMQGLCAVGDKGEFSSFEYAYKVLAKQAVDIADALIKQLNENDK